jgi:uncharacterized OsmC-like protein
MPFATNSVIARPLGGHHHAIVSARDNHLIVGSPRLRDTLSERSRPLDLLLAALATDSTFACQDAAQRLAIPVYSLTTTVCWAFEAEAAAEPRHLVVIRLAVSGPDVDQGAQLVEAITTTCQTYKLLAQALPIEFEVIL